MRFQQTGLRAKRAILRAARPDPSTRASAALAQDDNLVRPILFATLWGKKRRVLVSGRAYRDYFSMKMQFDTTNAERLLGPAGLRPPLVMEYLDKLFHYCVESDWGRKPVAAQ